MTETDLRAQIAELGLVPALKERIAELEAKLALANEYTQFCHDNHGSGVELDVLRVTCDRAVAAVTTLRGVLLDYTVDHRRRRNGACGCVRCVALAATAEWAA